MNDIVLRGKHIAVTGGCGFIGSHLVDALLAEGCGRVSVVDSDEYDTRRYLPADARLVVVKHRIGAGSGEMLRRAFDGAHLLFHLAAEKHSQSLNSPARVLDANVAGTLEVLQAAKAVGVQRVVFTSSVFAYGRMKGGPMLESEAPQPSAVYGISKLAGEGLCRHFAEKQGLPAVSMRLFFVYGPRQYANLGYKSVILKNFTRMAGGERPVIFGDGEQVLDYVYIADTIRAMLAAATRPITADLINIGSGQGVSINQLTAAMMKVAESKLTPEHQAPDETFGSCRVADLDRARRALGFAPVTGLEDGLRSVLNWMRAERNL